MTATGTCSDLAAVPAGCMPQVTVLPCMRSCRPERWRAAMLLPHSNPTPSLWPGQNHVKGKDPVMSDKTLLSVKLGRKSDQQL